MDLPFNPKLVIGDLSLNLVDMASGKTSRSRSAVASAKENGPKLEEGLNPFKSDKFDAESYVQSNCSLNDKVLFIFLFILHTYSIIHVV